MLTIGILAVAIVNVLTRLLEFATMTSGLRPTTVAASAAKRSERPSAE
jgi:hypothetical protein